MSIFEAINMNTGETINLLKLGADPANKIKPISVLCSQKKLLCPFCREAVSLKHLEDQIWRFTCDSPQCSQVDFADDKRQDEFQRKEEKYYNPEHFLDDDCF